MRGYRATMGVVAVAGNVLAVVFLRDMPSAYRLARLDEWVTAGMLYVAGPVWLCLIVVTSLGGSSSHIGKGSVQCTSN